MTKIFWSCRKNGKNTYTEKDIRFIMDIQDDAK